MSGDEFLVLLGGGALALVTLYRWYSTISTVSTLASRGSQRRTLLATPLLALGALFVVLRLWASWDVRSSVLYTVFYLALGGAWFGIVLWLLAFVGYHPRDDAVERGNRAVAPVVLGAGLGGMLAFAGGNIGDGPGWWVVIYCAMLSTGGMFGLLLAVEILVQPAEAVTVDRDLASGLRQGALALALGAVLGRAVAGDWISIAATCGDFLDRGWPSLVLAALAALLHRALKPTPSHPRPSVLWAGALPALLYLALAGLALWQAGWWA
jgi:hypothetical protein